MVVAVVACATSVGSFLRPKNVGEFLVSVAMVIFVVRTAAVCRLANKAAPVVRSIRVILKFVSVSIPVSIDVEDAEADGRRAVEMGIDRLKLLIIVSVRARVIQRVRIIHAGVQVGARLALVAEAERVADLLTHHMRAICLVVTAATKVRVVHLGRSLRYVDPAGNVYSGKAKPAIESIRGVTGVHFSSDHNAAFSRPRCAISSFVNEIENRGGRPVSKGAVEVIVPIRCVAVHNPEIERVCCTGPVVIPPGMTCC